MVFSLLENILKNIKVTKLVKKLCTRPKNTMSVDGKTITTLLISDVVVIKWGMRQISTLMTFFAWKNTNPTIKCDHNFNFDSFLPVLYWNWLFPLSLLDEQWNLEISKIMETYFIWKKNYVLSVHCRLFYGRQCL